MVRPGSNKGRAHKERSQPLERRHLGALEKKKDYKLRATDYQKKRDALHTLRKKALDRNPDEFNFHMINSVTKDGEHFEKEKPEDEDTKTQKQLLESRDLNYVAFKRHVEKLKIEKMKANLHLLDGQTEQKNKHTIFVDSKKEAKNFNPAKYLDTHPLLVDRVYNRPKLDTLEKNPIGTTISKRDVVRANRDRRAVYEELEKRIERERELSVVVDKLKARKDLADSKGQQRPVKVTKGSAEQAPVYRWKFQRKR